jgi:hypothetical protein
MSEPSSAPTAVPPAAGPLPLVIGVTGHRDIRPEDVPFLEGIVRATFVDVRDKCPHTPLVLLSPLAEGGDRLTARVAAEMGIRLVVPLPLPKELYVRDFETPESLAEFERLLARAESVVEMPLVEGNTLEAIRDYGAARNRQYALVGAYIARHSQLFIALWDGVEPAPGEKEGGTADIVKFRLEGAPAPFAPPRSPLTFAEHGPVFHIVTPRTRDPQVHGQAFTRQNLLPHHRTLASFESIYDNMERFNRDALALGAALAADIQQSQVYLLQEKAEKLAHAVASLPRASRMVLEQYAVADALAVHFAQKTLKASANLFVLVFVAALSFNIFHSFPHAKLEVEGVLAKVLHMPWFLAAFVGLFIYGSMVLHRRAQQGDYQNKYQDYRALAEGLRVQFFWSLAGVSESVVDHYLRRQRGELEWIRSALMSWDVVAHAEPVRRHHHAATHADRLQMVRRLWVVDQRNYFKSKAQKEHHALEKDEARIERLLNVSLGLAAALAAVLIVPHLLPLHVLEVIMHAVEIPAVHGAIMLAIVMLLVAAGLRHGYNQQLARSEHAKQFSRMSAMFDIGERQLYQLLIAGDHDRAEELIKELGAEALEENGDWVLLHRERPLEVPHAG